MLGNFAETQLKTSQQPLVRKSSALNIHFRFTYRIMSCLFFKKSLFLNYFYCFYGKEANCLQNKNELSDIYRFFSHKISVTRFLMSSYFLCGEHSDTVLQQVPTSHLLSVWSQATLSFCAPDWTGLTCTLKSAKPFMVKFPSTVPTFLRWTLFLNK